MVNESLHLLPYRQAVWWHSDLTGQVRALSGLADCDGNAPYVQWLNQLFRHCATPGQPPRRLGASELPQPLAASWDSWLPAYALLLPLAGENSHGALLLARDQPFSDYELTLSSELAHGYGHALARFNDRHPWLKSGWRPRHGGRWLLLGLLLLALVPIKFTVLAPAEVTPSQPMLVRAPINGVIDQLKVAPNQAVMTGELLFSLDATTLAGQYALASKAQEAAREAYRQSAQRAVTDPQGKLEMALDKARLDEKTIEAEVTARQLKRIQVTAARDGVVVFTSESDLLGRAVAAGERVMTLADPDKVELTAYLPASETLEVSPGTAITLYPNASPIDAYEATISRVAYQAEPTESGVLAYRLQAEFSPGQPLPRIGQMGTARIHGDWVPLGYYLLRRPLTWLRQWFGW